MSKFQQKNHLSYHEPERSKTEWKKQWIDVNTKMTKLLELTDKDFNALDI